MTDRLYYDHTYQREFDAQVLSCREEDGKWAVVLDRSCFYPTSGGQPYDTGALGGANIVDVVVDKTGEVVHYTDAPLVPGNTVHGEIDWARRFDHMQQHAGEHMLANAAYRHLGGTVQGLHLGQDFSSIDVELPGGEMRVDAETLQMLEDDVNERIERDVPIRCWFPDAEELSALPLRKAPTVTEHVRIVKIGEEELVACGGTHPARAGEIGLLKIIDARPSRGKMRLCFLCGKRALRDYQKRFALINAAASALSTSYETLPETVETMRDRLKDAQAQVNAMKREKLLGMVDDIRAQAVEAKDGWKIVAWDAGEQEANAVKELAALLIKQEKTVALIGAPGTNNCLLAFAASENCPWNMGKILSAAAKQYGGKGGGRPDFAQGSATSIDAVWAARQAVLAE